MEHNKITKVLYNSPCWTVLRHVVAHSDRMVKGSRLVKALPQISKSAIYNAIQGLEKINVLIKEEDDGGYVLNRDNVWLQFVMSADRVIVLQPLVDALSEIASRIVLFGSQANGDYTSDSDFDLLVISFHDEEIRRIIAKSKLAERIQLIHKRPEEWIDFHETNPVLYDSIQRGIVLWERK